MIERRISYDTQPLTRTTGNDPDQDSDREPDPPTKVKEQPVQRTGKRNAGGEGPSGDGSRGAGGGRGGGQQVFQRADIGTCKRR